MRAPWPILAAGARSGCVGVGLTPYGTPLGSDETADTDIATSDKSDTPKDDDGEDTSGDTASDEKPTIDSVEPAYGTNAGNTRVTLTGTGLKAGLTVTFDGRNATIISARGKSAVVDTPATNVTGPVKVGVVAAGGKANLADGYRYWKDGTGLVGGTFGLEKVRYRGQYWVSPDLAWSAFYGGFIEPADFAYWKLFTAAQGTCSHNYDVDGSPYRSTGASTLTVSSAANDFDLALSTTTPGYYDSGDLGLNDVLGGSSWALDPVTGSADWPPFALPDLFTGPENFEVTAPVINGNSSPLVSRGFRIAWNGSGGDYMLISLTRYSFLSGTTSAPTAVERVTCSVPDTGQYTTASNAFPTWRRDANDYLVIRVGRINVTTATLPMDGSTVEARSESWVIGAADMGP